jgi:hypothetical protein
MLLDHPVKDLAPKMPSILEDMGYSPLNEPADPIPQNPGAPKPSQCTILAPRVVQATQYRASRRWESSELPQNGDGRLRHVDAPTDCELGFSGVEVREVPIKRVASLRHCMREKRKSLQVDAASASEPSEDDAEHPWYHGSDPEDLAQFRETFIHDVELWRMQQCRYTPTPRMPSMLNPVRKDAPPRSWIYLENPYPSCRAWKMTSSILDRRERSR